MACFTAPMAAGIVTTVFRKKIPEKYHISWFNALVWGGVAGLALEHLASGEVVPYPPFLTAMTDPADAAVMVHEIFSTGLAMLALCALTWAVMVYAASSIRHSLKGEAKQAA